MNKAAKDKPAAEDKKLLADNRLTKLNQYLLGSR